VLAEILRKQPLDQRDILTFADNPEQITFHYFNELARWLGQHIVAGESSARAPISLRL
jgi:hypothetical protein